MSLSAEATTRLTVSYDEVPYDGLTHSETHPSLLATVASLMGMHPAPVEQCRVLEIGCAQGFNLIAMALQLPQSEFVGIDFAPGQIAVGQKAVDELGATNVKLFALDLLHLDPSSLGRFDFIIAHGFFSWVPQSVRDRLLAVYRQLLTPDGVGYISYNAYPGGHFMNILRDGMLFHAGRISAPQERAAEARRWVDILVETGKNQLVPYSGFYRAYRQLVQDYQEHLGGEAGRSNAGLLHDEMEEFNTPFYLREFVAQCQAAGLQYLGDTEFASMLASNVPESVAQFIQAAARSRVEAEQYLDFVRNRMFRRSLVCHQEIGLSGKPSMQTVAALAVSSSARGESLERPAGERPAFKFISPDLASLSTDHPITIAAFDYLSDVWPRRVAFPDLLRQAAQRSQSAPDAKNAQALAANLLKAYSISPVLVELHRFIPVLVTTVSERPTASPWARWQVRQNNRSICNLLHKRVLLDEPDCFLLVRLDGTRTVDDLCQELLGGPLHEGHWHVKEEQSPAKAGKRTRSTLGKREIPLEERVAQIVRDRLEWLALAGLLVG